MAPEDSVLRVLSWAVPGRVEDAGGGSSAGHHGAELRQVLAQGSADDVSQAEGDRQGVRQKRGAPGRIKPLLSTVYSVLDKLSSYLGIGQKFRSE